MEREEKEKKINKEDCHWWEDPEAVEEIRKINESLCKIHREEFKEYL